MALGQLSRIHKFAAPSADAGGDQRTMDASKRSAIARRWYETLDAPVLVTRVALRNGELGPVLRAVHPSVLLTGTCSLSARCADGPVSDSHHASAGEPASLNGPRASTLNSAGCAA